MQEKPLYSLDKLKEIDDTEEFILQVITIFLETVPANTEALVKACAEKDWEQVYFFAHKIKANINLLGIDCITDDIRFVEQSAKGGVNLEMISSKVSFIKSTVYSVCNKIKKDFPL